jgi:hypothetical protein
MESYNGVHLFTGGRILPSNTMELEAIFSFISYKLTKHGIYSEIIKS